MGQPIVLDLTDFLLLAQHSSCGALYGGVSPPSRTVPDNRADR
jgi:hypothetical protein